MTQIFITVKKEHIIENVISKSRFIADIKIVGIEDMKLKHLLLQ